MRSLLQEESQAIDNDTSSLARRLWGRIKRVANIDTGAGIFTTASGAGALVIGCSFLAAGTPFLGPALLALGGTLILSGVVITAMGVYRSARR